MVDNKIVDQLAGLPNVGMRSQLITVSGGHVGRVCRVVCEATYHALRRGAPAIERYDLSVATREFAINVKWVGHDPFSAPNRS